MTTDSKETKIVPPDWRILELHMKREQWERTSSAWKELHPLHNYDYHNDPSNETFAEYQTRIARLGYDIPLEVIEQWIFPFYYHGNTVDNYGWINYRNATFERKLIPLEDLLELHAVEALSDRVESCSSRNSISEFACTPENRLFWEQYRTWRTPPVVLDILGIEAAPAWTELRGPLQLIEGHSRLGHLKAMHRLDLGPREEHEVFLLSLGDPN